MAQSVEARFGRVVVPMLVGFVATAPVDRIEAQASWRPPVVRFPRGR